MDEVKYQIQARLKLGGDSWEPVYVEAPKKTLLVRARDNEPECIITTRCYHYDSIGEARGSVSNYEQALELGIPNIIARLCSQNHDRLRDIAQLRIVKISEPVDC